jgi:hypothetical protein
MFTVLSNIRRSSSLYWIATVAVAVVVLLTFAVLPAMSAAKPALVPVMRNSEITSDYFLRHPELGISAAPAINTNSDFYQRHPEWTSNVENIVSATGSSELSDYFQRHLELGVPAGMAIDTADYFLRHPELRPAAPSRDLSDYFLRH